MMTLCPQCSLYWNKRDMVLLGKVKICPLCHSKLKKQALYEKDEIIQTNEKEAK